MTDTNTAVYLIQGDEELNGENPDYMMMPTIEALSLRKGERITFERHNRPIILKIVRVFKNLRRGSLSDANAKIGDITLHVVREQD